MSLTHNMVYLELAVDIEYAGKGSIIKQIDATVGDYAVYPKLYGIVIAIDRDSKLVTDYGIKQGDTVAISKDINIEPFTIIGPNERMPNPFCALYSFKTNEELEFYSKDITNGPTILIEDYKVYAKITNAVQEVYPVVLPSPKFELYVPNTEIIN